MVEDKGLLFISTIKKILTVTQDSYYEKIAILLTICLVTITSYGKEDSQNHMYPIEIERLGLTKQYDIAKWQMYCIHSGESHYLF